MKERIREIVIEHARLPAEAKVIDDSTDLYMAGMTSYASVALMLALENEFELEFPDSMLSRGVFQTVDNIANAIQTLHQMAL
jgi:acyl carrier protein